MGELMDQLVGVNSIDVPEVIFNYGKVAYKELFQDYECNLVFSGKVGKTVLTTEKALELFEANPDGYGFKIEKEDSRTIMGQFCFKVIAKEISLVNKDVKGLSIDDPDNDDAFGDVRRKVGKLNGYGEKVKNYCKTVGNGLKSILSNRGRNIRIVGDKEGIVNIYVSGNSISETNNGDHILHAVNSCDHAFEVNDKIRGLQGASGAVKENHYASFHVEENDLYLWESWFENGKEKFNEIEYGPLVGK